MAVTSTASILSARAAETLYTEALLLADESRAYFDRDGRADSSRLDPHTRVQFACESLRATTRLMQAIAWLAMRRAIDTGEVAEGDPRSPERGLIAATPSEPDVLGRLPGTARRLILAGIDLHERVGRLADNLEAPIATASPARVLLERLERAF